VFVTFPATDVLKRLSVTSLLDFVLVKFETHIRRLTVPNGPSVQNDVSNMRPCPGYTSRGVLFFFFCVFLSFEAVT